MHLSSICHTPELASTLAQPKRPEISSTVKKVQEFGFRFEISIKLIN